MSTARHHAEWLSLLEISGPFLSMPVLLDAFPQGLDAYDAERAGELRAAYEEWADNQGSLQPDPAIHTAWLHYVLRNTLDLPDEVVAEGQAIPEGIKATIPEHGEIPPPSEAPDLKEPEWQVLTHYNPQLSGDDFRLRPVEPPARYTPFLDQVILVERLREVRAMVGFARLDAVGELTDPDLNIQIEPAPLSRQPPTWVPAAEVRGEGLFIQFNEAKILEWLAQPAIRDRGDEFLASHKKWRGARFIEPQEQGFPGMRYVLIHSFAHALMRQLTLECGYAAASIRERIYARPAESPGGPMAGVLLYTSAPDSEGTLGGLVSLGEAETLVRHIGQALEAAHLCASDPLCAEHPPSRTGRTLHAAACHACLFAPETSCERGNKYLDRSVLVKTVERDDLAFFE